MKFESPTMSSEQQLLVAELVELPCFVDQKITNVSIIDGGLSQPCFKVTVDNLSYFAKYLANNNTEAVASTLAAATSIAPAVIYVGNTEAGKNWLVTAFIIAQSLDKVAMPNREKLTVLLTLLARCHQINYPNELSTRAYSNKIPSLNLPSTIDKLTQQAQLTLSQQQEVKHLKGCLEHQLAKVHCQVNEQVRLTNVFCHGDANFSNVLQQSKVTKSGNEAYQLIDFECACIAPIEYDLAMLMAVNDIDISQAETILSQYKKILTFDETEDNKQSDIVEDLTLISDDNLTVSAFLVTCYYDYSLLINSLWYFSQFRVKKQVKYKILAEKQLSELHLRHLR